jgi:uncharacterized membrane protein YfcA
MSPLAVLLALIIGLTLGLLGGGGSILTVPVFVYALGLEPKRAIAMSLPVVGGAALVGAFQHWRKGNVILGTALPFGAAAMAGAFLGARLAGGINGHIQLAMFAVVMLGAAISMIRSAQRSEPATPRDKPSWGALLAIGVGVGSVTGLVGAGGGFLIVPALVILGGLPMSHAVGTSLLVISMNTLSGFLGYQGAVDVDWPLVGAFGGVTAVGIVAGSALVSHVPQRTLKVAFAVLLLLIGSWILFQYGSL